MAGIPGIPTKVVSSGGRHYSGDSEDDEVFVHPYIAARFLPRAIPRQFTLGDGLNYNGIYDTDFFLFRCLKFILIENNVAYI